MFAARLSPRIAVCTLALAAALPAQVQWQRFDYPHVVAGPFVFDAARDRFVMLAAPNGIGQPETWEWDRGAGWLHRFPANAPPWRGGHALAHDVLRGVTVLFSGYGFSTFSFRETYEWNGVDWVNRSPAVQPSVRQGHAMAYDLLRGKVVMFGGLNPDPNGGYYADTWEWDGTAWTPQAAPGPSARNGHGLVYDLARADVVLFGGKNGGGSLGDTWTYAAGTWAPRPSGPPARSDFAMAHDAGRACTVLFGGSPAYGSFLDDTWEWDGGVWIPMAAAIRPSPRAYAGLAGDPVGGGVLLAGGGDFATGSADTWRWDGIAWTLLANLPRPMHRHSHAAAFDDTRGELLVFGGVNATILGDFWRWNGTQWAAGPAGPAPRMRAAMAHDAARGETVMFGGDSPFTNQTWTWNGVAWSQRAPPTSPAARALHAMAYDRQRARVVLFGGFQNVFNNYYLGDTWEWDGTNWLQRAAAGPLPRHGHAIAYDAARGVTVLYGGVGAGQPFGTAFTDTWEWNGTAWTRRLPANDPGPRREFGMAFDTARERVVVFGDTSSQDAWEWDGTNWLLRAVTTAPPARGRSALVFDTWREHALLFGGQSSGPNHADLWRYGPVVAAAVIPFGSGCAGSMGLPQISAARPWLGDAVPVVVSNGPGSALAAIWIGLSNTAYGSSALPLALGPFGMPGCSLLTSIDAFVLTPASPAGEATLPFSVPNQPVLLGFEVHGQGAFLDATANLAGIAMAGALTLRLGGR